MSFPARRDFKRDRRRNITDVKVYEFLEEELDHVSPRVCKLAWISKETGLQETHIAQALKRLVAWGYLVDHRTHEKDPRLLTLTRCLPEELHKDAIAA